MPKTLKYISILILSLVLLAGCSNTSSFPEEDNSIIVQGKLIIPGLETTVHSEVIDTVKENSLNTLPLQTAFFNRKDYIIKFNQDVDENYIKNEILKNSGKVVSKIAGNDTFKIHLDDENNLILLDALENSDLISYIEPDYLIHIQTVPNDTGYNQQWNLSMLGLEKTWDSFKGSQNVTVAVVDTGILPDHPDLRDKIVGGYDFIDNDSDPTDTDPDFSHGTHVAGIIGAMTNNNLGVAGVDWNVKIMPVRVIGPGGNGGYSALISGIHWAVDNGADVINLSLGGSVDSVSLREAIDYAINNGVTIVAAAGNNGTSPILYPASYPEVISVGAIGPSGERSYYSNYDPNLDLVAPGGDNSIFTEQYNTIISTAGYMGSSGPIHQYTWAQGTSMATPHVTGIVGLLYSTGITDPGYIQQLLKDTADDLGQPGKDDEYGYGLINVNRALDLSDMPPLPDDPDTDTGSAGDLLKKAKVYAVNETDSSSNGQTSVQADSSGRFSFILKPGTWTFTTWIDVNGSSSVDNGDYYKVLNKVKIDKDNRNISIELDTL